MRRLPVRKMTTRTFVDDDDDSAKQIQIAALRAGRWPAAKSAAHGEKNTFPLLDDSLHSVVEIFLGIRCDTVISNQGSNLQSWGIFRSLDT